MTGDTMKILVVGASGGSGKAAVQRLLAAGHEVTAFSRHADRLPIRSERLRVVNGDAIDPAQLERAVAGHDAVVVTLGISESALRVRLLGSAATPLDVRSTGTRNVVAAMRRCGARRLVVQTSYGVGDTRARLPMAYRLMFALLLKPQIEDTERQERVVRESGLDWTLARPVNLTDEPGDDARPFVSPSGETAGMKVSREKVARFLAEAVDGTGYLRQAVALSSPGR